MKSVEWLGPARPDKERSLQVERRPAREENRPGDIAGGDYFALGSLHPLERLPYFAVRTGDGVEAVAALALSDEDLVLLGAGAFRGLDHYDACSAVLREAIRAAEETGRRRVLVPVTNADLLAMLHLQAEGFTLASVTPWEGPERRGVAGILATHELLFIRPVA